MKFIKKALTTALGFALVYPLITSAGNEVVIGDIDDMAGLYSDVLGPGGVEAAKMAIEDFGGTVLGKKIIFLIYIKFIPTKNPSWIMSMTASNILPKKN